MHFTTADNPQTEQELPFWQTFEKILSRSQVEYYVGDFKENILEEVSRGRLFNANYPLLIQHIQREAKLYRATVMELLDPSEEELILTADHVLREANHYIRLLETDCDKK